MSKKTAILNEGKTDSSFKTGTQVLEEETKKGKRISAKDINSKLDDGFEKCLQELLKVREKVDYMFEVIMSEDADTIGSDDDVVIEDQPNKKKVKK